MRFDNFTQENICLYANNCFVPRRSRSLPARAQRSFPSFLSRASRLSRVFPNPRLALANLWRRQCEQNLRNSHSFKGVSGRNSFNHEFPTEFQKFSRSSNVVKWLIRSQERYGRLENKFGKQDTLRGATMTLCGLKEKMSSQYLKNRIPPNETTTLGTKPSENGTWSSFEHSL